jgi:hypothetical protein
MCGISSLGKLGRRGVVIRLAGADPIDLRPI